MADEDIGSTVDSSTENTGGAGDEALGATEVEHSTPVDSTPTEENFVDPSTLPAEIKAHWKQMHRTYNQKLAEIKAKQADIDLVAQYRSNPHAAEQFIRSEARRLGISLAEARAATNEAPQPSGQPVPADLVALMKADMPQELAWLADSLAPTLSKVVNRLVQSQTAPLAERQRQAEIDRHALELEGLAAELSERAPGWEAHDKDMLSLLEFMGSGRMRDPRWGSKLELLHKLADGGQAATVNALQRMGEAARNKTTTGQPARASVTNISDRVRAAKNVREAMLLASRAAIDEMKAAGHAVPD